MQLRRSARLLAAAGALLLATPVLASCGFGYATDRIYTPGAGVNDRDADIDVLNAVIVSGQEGSGTFVASFANNDTKAPGSVTAITASKGDTALTVSDFDPIEIPAAGLVYLAAPGSDVDPITVTGDYAPGDFVDVTITFGDGESVDMEIPTMTACGDYEGLDASATSTDEDQCATPEAETESEH